MSLYGPCAEAVRRDGHLPRRAGQADGVDGARLGGGGYQGHQGHQGHQDHQGHQGHQAGLNMSSLWP